MNEMRERLKQLLQEAEGQAAYYDGDDAYGVAVDYLLDNGVIVPPVRVGQTVWFAMFNGVVDDYVNQFLMDIGTYLYSFDEIGKTVFLTREAAEEALKARENK